MCRASPEGRAVLAGLGVRCQASLSAGGLVWEQQRIAVWDVEALAKPQASPTDR